nr:hypothetical protein [Tanacetum cinerariifolium]
MPETYQYSQQQQQNQLQQQQPQQGSSSRLALRTSNTGGEIVQVQGGHIVRSTGRKDRHSKVCTAKGPRDRRVRLSAHTAIQFYDVQDRLGYDRPSKAVDWLIKKAKTAIDELAQLPAWKPTNGSRNEISTSNLNFEQDPDQGIGIQEYPNDENGNESFLPPSLDQDSIADTIKSFFPMGASSNGGNNSSSADMHQFNQSQDLRLSLQSFQDHPIMHNHHGHSHNHNSGNGNTSGTNNNMFFDGSSWSDDTNPAHQAHHAHQTGGFQRMVTWGGGGGGDGISAGFGSAAPVVAQAPQMSFLQPLFGQPSNSQLFTQRGPLQSSNAPSFRAWIDPPPVFTGVAIDQQPTLAFHHPSSMSGYASGLGGFSGFRIPTRIQGEDEEHDGVSDKPSSASSDSRH